MDSIPPRAEPAPDRKSLTSWDRAKRSQTKRVLITAYDHPFAKLAEQAGIDGILIGDSLGMTIQGGRDTLRVSLEHMLYHTEIVARAAQACLIMADLPFGSFEASPAQAFASAALLVKAGADIIKLEGGAPMVETVAFLSARAIPVCAHIGLTPQHVRQLGGFKKQGKTADAAALLLADAQALAEAGARMVLMEAIPAPLATEITKTLTVPTIGIGAGPGTDAQILVLHDVLGLSGGYVPGFARTYLDGASLMRDAIGRYADEVRTQAFPPPG
ncbi:MULTISPECIES: 3-methyl-2-oxobutanoate hydroxymethyltransferase [Acidiphilium]|uniref:3-methyl-2-oxobutanoate hydroxymethyltransferase n=1 Tax=Acidiphilium rubrum TaxID=526 RepID=A0A8G2CKF7_ACIRU|nr:MULTISPECIES: 3-methyl-2-oxobutanoate hydroxymethyltransferase [Acidiphilium]SIQ76340.1 ketopantoate hydroxymethyltransferase [Acidiphilium rubrum]